MTQSRKPSRVSRPGVSVAVPTYRRAEMLLPLIRSFQAQTLEDAELLLCDDSGDDNSVTLLALREAAHDPRIRLERNPKNLGYSRNLLRTLEHCSGEFIVVLGDDDLLASEDALQRYFDAFTSHPDVDYVYSNILQCDGEFNVDYVFEHFTSDSYFPAGYESLAGTWLKSCYIPGIGLRNNINFADLYPPQEMLFPQVELVGRILMTGASYGLSGFPVAGRAHADQLGFEAIRGRRITGTERHAVEELYVIAHRMDVHLGTRSCIRIVQRFFRSTQATIYPVEKIRAGSASIATTFARSIRRDPAALLDVRYLGYFLVALLVPGHHLDRLKEWRKRRIVKRRFLMQCENFYQYLRLVTGA